MKDLIIKILNFTTIALLVCAGIWQTSTWMKDGLSRWASTVHLAPETEVIRTAAERNGIEPLLDAIEYVESKCNKDAIGDNGNAVGSFQIWKIYVNDVNRILKLQGEDTVYFYRARQTRSGSRDMVRIFLNHYGGTFEEMARKHNGGPQGHKKESTKPYWEKVKAELYKRIDKE